MSTTVRYPLLRWSTCLAGAGLVYGIISWYLFYLKVNPVLMAIPLVFLGVMFFFANDVDAARIHTYIKYGYGEDVHLKWARAGTEIRGLLLWEMNLIYLNAVLFAAVLLVLGT